MSAREGSGEENGTGCKRGVSGISSGGSGTVSNRNLNEDDDSSGGSEAVSNAKRAEDSGSSIVVDESEHEVVGSSV